MAQRAYLFSSIVSYVVLAVVAVVGLLGMYRAGQPWWIAAGLLFALGILYYRWSRQPFHLHLAIETALIVSLVAFRPGDFVFLCFILSGHATYLLPNRTGALWIAFLALATGAIYIYQNGWASGLLWTTLITSGYASFGFFSYAWTQAEEARQKSQALLAELQTAHRQLQDYADQVEELAGAEERYRLAREMHDTLGHRLTVTAVQLEGAQRLIPSDPERAARMVGTVRNQVREALSELRRTVATLRTPLEAGLSLPHALARLAAGFEEATGLTVHLTLAEDMPALPDSHRLALYRAAQEALTNVQRHAQAQDVWLQSAWRDEEVVLLVSDDGVGFPPIAEQRGFGLRGLMERATQLGGALTLESRPGGGARLSFRLPLPTEETNG